MASRLAYVALLAALPLLAAPLVALDLADAAKAPSRSGSERMVCGDRLCSEVPGGYEAWKDSADRFSRDGPGAGEGDRMEGDHMMEDRMEGDHMMEDRMEGDHMMEDRMEGDHMKGDRMMEDRMEGDHMKGDRMMEDRMEGDHMKGDRMGGDKHMKAMHEGDPGSLLRLSRANVPATIPLHHGLYDGGDVYYIITDASDREHAEALTEAQGWRVEVAPPLASTPAEALSAAYVFANGVEGGGIHGYQAEVFASTPAQPESYSALASPVRVTWGAGEEPRVLSSEREVLDAESAGEVSLEESGAVLNMPHVAWPGGQMPVKEDAELRDDTPYGGGQVLEIDTDGMTVTFVAHRGWGPDGRTIYYIVTDATPAGPAGGMGVVHSPTSASLLLSPAAVDLFQFSNGIAGPGPLGFQPGIAASAPGDETYSPMWRISLVTWDDPAYASLLETRADVGAMSQAGLVGVSLARPMDSDHIVNCPFIDPFQ